MLHTTLFLFTVLSQTTTEVITQAPTWWTFVLESAPVVLGGLFVWLLKRYGGKLVALITEKSGSPFLGEIAQRALVTVLSFYQSEVKHLKKTTEWNDTSKARLKRNAIEHLKMMLDADKVAAAAGEMSVEDFLGHHVEAAVTTAKQMGRSAAKTPPADPTRG